MCVLLVSDMEEQIKIVKRKEPAPKCMFEGGKYIINERAGDTVQITNGKETFCVGIQYIKPTNKEGRELCG